MNKLNKITKKIIDGELLIQRDAFFHVCDFMFIGGEDNYTYADDWNTSIESCEAEDIQENSIVYCGPHSIYEFLSDVHPKIKNRYIIMMWQGWPQPSLEIPKDGKIKWWFNTIAGIDDVILDNCTPIPYGIFLEQNAIINKYETIKIFDEANRSQKTVLLYSNFAKRDVKERHDLYNMFKDKSFTKSIDLTDSTRKPIRDFISEMATAKFVLTPIGHTHDSSRAYEALLVGSIPVMIKSKLDRLFIDNNLPVVLVDDYAQITEDFLNKEYEVIKNKRLLNIKPLYMQYWIDKITKVTTTFA